MKQQTDTAQKWVEEGNALHQAIRMAGKAHKGQVRKGTQIDYLVHPMEVLEILSSMHADVHVCIAGVLHDTLEDTALSLNEIREAFGEDVAELVERHTEKKEQPWQKRKQQHIDALKKGSDRYRMMVLADSISNLRSMAYDYAQEGESFWQRFRAPKERQSWYYHAMREAMADLNEHPDTAKAYQEMEALCYQVFGER